MFSFFLNGTEMFTGIECQQVVVAETEKIWNFDGALTCFMQEHLQHLKNRTMEPIYPRYLVLSEGGKNHFILLKTDLSKARLSLRLK